jgi:hypothetical protein
LWESFLANNALWLVNIDHILLCSISGVWLVGVASGERRFGFAGLDWLDFGASQRVASVERLSYRWWRFWACLVFNLHLKLVFLFLLLRKHVGVLLNQLLFTELLHFKLEANEVILLHLVLNLIFAELFLIHQLLLNLESIAYINFSWLVFVRALHEHHLPFFNPLELSLGSLIQVIELDLTSLTFLVVAQDHSFKDFLHFGVFIVDLLLLEDFGSGFVSLLDLLGVSLRTIFNETFKVLIQAILILLVIILINLLANIVIFLIVGAKLSLMLKELLWKLSSSFLLFLTALLLLLEYLLLFDGIFALLLEDLVSIDWVDFRLLDWLVCLRSGISFSRGIDFLSARQASLASIKLVLRVHLRIVLDALNVFFFIPDSIDLLLWLLFTELWVIRFTIDREILLTVNVLGQCIITVDIMLLALFFTHQVCGLKSASKFIKVDVAAFFDDCLVFELLEHLLTDSQVLVVVDSALGQERCRNELAINFNHFGLGFFTLASCFSLFLLLGSWVVKF